MLEPRLSRPIRALARSDSVALVVTPGELLLIDARTGRALPGLPAANVHALSEITAAAIDDRSIWVTGTGGLLVVTRATGVSRFLASRGDIPSDALDVALDRDYGWLATAGGLMRLRRLTDGSIP